MDHIRYILAMNTALIRQAVDNGTWSWDHLMLKVLSLKLLSCLSAKSGDVVRSGLYQGVEYL